MTHIPPSGELRVKRNISTPAFRRHTNVFLSCNPDRKHADHKAFSKLRGRAKPPGSNKGGDQLPTQQVHAPESIPKQPLPYQVLRVPSTWYVFFQVRGRTIRHWLRRNRLRTFPKSRSVASFRGQNGFRLTNFVQSSC